MFRNGKHGAANLFCAGKVAGKHSAQEWKYWFSESIENPVGLCSGLLAVGGFDGCRTEDVALEWHGQDGIFGFAFDARPHHAAFFRAICAGTGDEDESYFRMEAS